MDLTLQYIRKHSSTILIVLILFIFYFVFFTYTFFHEVGHAIIGFLFGQSLTEFDLSFWDLSAHVRMNGDLTQFQRALQSAAGFLLPLLLWTLFISVVPRKSNPLVEGLKFLASMAVINTVLPWIVLPLLFLFGKAPSDDVTNFLRHSQTSPLLLTFMAALLYLGGWLLFLAKTDVRDVFHRFKITDRYNFLSGTRSALVSMVGLLIFCAIVTFTFSGWAAKNSAYRFSPPQGFISIAEIDLSKQPHSSETLTQFALEKSSYVGVFVVIRNINTSYFDLSVKGTNRFSSTVLHGEGYNALQDGGLWEKDLPAGTYQVVLTSAQNKGTVSVYLRDH